MYFLIDEENGGDHEQIDSPNNVIIFFEIVLSTMALIRNYNNTWIFKPKVSMHVIGNDVILDEVKQHVDQYSVKII
jgi:hypothetical protein